MRHMMVSFLIVNRNGGEVFKKEIESIIENVKEAKIKEYEIVVVDNASTDDTSWLKKISQVVLKKIQPMSIFLLRQTIP